MACIEASSGLAQPTLQREKSQNTKPPGATSTPTKVKFVGANGTWKGERKNTTRQGEASPRGLTWLENLCESARKRMDDFDYGIRWLIDFLSDSLYTPFLCPKVPGGSPQEYGSFRVCKRRNVW